MDKAYKLLQVRELQISDELIHAYGLTPEVKKEAEAQQAFDMFNDDLAAGMTSRESKHAYTNTYYIGPLIQKHIQNEGVRR